MLAAGGLLPAGFGCTGITEGPWITVINGQYLMTYSGASADSEFYRIGVATAASPLGPYLKSEHNPITKTTAARSPHRPLHARLSVRGIPGGCVRWHRASSASV